ncbi:MAG: RagB/SusD family nutrient uptake outer membrane protein [Bacteroidota bacterium]
MKTIYRIIILGVLLTSSSCMKEVLDKKPLDIISSADLWSDASLIESYLAQTYYQSYVLTNDCTEDDIWGYSDAWFGQFVVNDMSDECKANWWNGPAMNKKYFGLNVDGGVLEWWEGSYQVIRMLNEFIAKVPESPIDEELKSYRTAEARFLRAFNYFSMVKRYGGVPLITYVQSLDEPDEALYPARNTEKEVYDFVIDEVDEILNDLPEATTDFGRPSRYAALALQSRAALYAASIAQFVSVQLEGVVGIDESLANEYYQISYDASKAIMDGPHDLYNVDADKVENFKNVFLVEDNIEVIFARKHDYTSRFSGGTGWSYDFFQAPSPCAWGGGNQDGVYLEMIEEFENIDGSSGKLDRVAIQQGLWTVDELFGQREPRFKASIYTQDDVWKGAVVDFHNGLVLPDGTIKLDASYEGVMAVGDQFTIKRGTGATSFGVMKYLDEGHDTMGPRASSGTDYIVFRYGEVLLNFAEAAFELGKPAEAMDAMNLLRDRAGVALLTSIDQQIIRHERKVELAFEGHRYWDVRRWRTGVETLGRTFSGLRFILDYTTRKYKMEVIDPIEGDFIPVFSEANYYLPITMVRTGNNPNLVENPGY